MFWGFLASTEGSLQNVKVHMTLGFANGRMFVLWYMLYARTAVLTQDLVIAGQVSRCVYCLT